MNPKQRYFAAARRQSVDRIPTHFRASKVLTRRLMTHLGIDPAGGLGSAEALLAQLGADFWASGSRVDARRAHDLWGHARRPGARPLARDRAGDADRECPGDL
jgi:hypothetical protein